MENYYEQQACKQIIPKSSDAKQLIACFLIVLSMSVVSAQVPAGSGLGSLRYSEHGKLGLLFTEVEPDQQDQYRLLYRERDACGSWSDPSVVIDFNEDIFSEETWGLYDDAWLFFDEHDEPLVFVMPNDSDSLEIRLMKKNNQGGWSLVSMGVLPDRLSTSENEFDRRSFQQMAASQGRSGDYHFVVRYSDDLGPGSLLYARFNEGAWAWEFARRDIQNWLLNDVAAPDWGFGVFRFIPRNLGLAIDAAGKAHIVYSAEPFVNPISGGTELRSDLLYLSNVSGSWRNEVLLSPGSGFGDAGASASIAVAPNGVIAVASIYIPRARTGSPGRASLRYFTKNMNGTWSQSTVTDTSDNYLGGDGERGTGMHPFLLFDEQSRPRIVFNDYASQHWPGFGAEAYSGQIRLAMRDNPLSGNWTISTLLTRGSVPATDHWVFWPAMASSRGETVVAAQSWRFFPSVGGSEPREEFATHFFTVGALPPILRPAALGHLETLPGDSSWSFSSALQTVLSRVNGIYFSPDYGWIRANPWCVEWWISSDYFGLVHFGRNENQYAGWVSSERFSWMRFVADSTGKRYLWVDGLKTWLVVNADGSFYSFDFGWLIPQVGSLTRYNSRIGIVINDSDNPAGWLRSDRFGYVWFARDGTGVWFWSQLRNEWIGIT